MIFLGTEDSSIGAGRSLRDFLASFCDTWTVLGRSCKVGTASRLRCFNGTPDILIKITIHAILYGELHQGKRNTGWPCLRYMDYIKRHIDAAYIDIINCEEFAHDRHT